MASRVEGDASTFPLNPQTALLDTFFPGFSLLSAALSRYLKVDVALYIPTVLAIGLLIAGSQYAVDYFWEKMAAHFMSTADIRVDDEIYNMFISWIAAQKFAKTSRQFVPQTNLNSRSWALWRFNEDNDDELDNEESKEGSSMFSSTNKKIRPLQYTPSFGTHYFWYKGRLLLFNRSQASQPQGFMPVSEREEMSISMFGRDPTVLKELLDECRVEYMKHDENRTVIYRGAMKPGTTEPVWTRCMSRISRPFSTVVLDEAVKQSLLEDMQDYLHPLTQRWYANRGIPYRRGYLLTGPPGTGKSSLSFAVAGYFKLKIYIVSLNSLAMNEENLSTLFAELPKKCVVLLEDIDTAGLTHARQSPEKTQEDLGKTAMAASGTAAPAVASNNNGRISLSALLNVIDGVASQEGRVLIMTTNHIEKLDEALIRPGRVDMTVKFGLADKTMVKTLFKGIYATLEGDLPKSTPDKDGVTGKGPRPSAPTKEDGEATEKAKIEKQRAEEARISALADEFSVHIPNHVFSPAEVQGFLLKNKRNPEVAVSGAEQWVKDTIAQKEKNKKAEKERLAKEAEEAKKADEEKKSEEKKAQEEEKTDDKSKTTTEKENIANETTKTKARMTNGIEKGTMTNGIVKEPMMNGMDTIKMTNGIEMN